MSGDLWTTEEVAAQVGVTPAAIRIWTMRGYLSPVAKRGKANLYRLSTVLAVEAQRPDKFRRKA